MRVGAGVLVAALALAACGAHGGEAVGDGRFAPELEIDLSAMERMESGLYVQTLKAGDGAIVRPGQTVRVHYTGWLPDGTKFDSSRDRGEPLSIPIGMGRVIEGWDQGIVGMAVGERRRLVIPPELGYGSAGAGGVIPPDATLIFDIELLGIR